MYDFNNSQYGVDCFNKNCILAYQTKNMVESKGYKRNFQK